jgi:hypothetical protein
MNHFEEIRKWAKERGILDIEYQPLPQIGFLIEELHEFITAKDDNGRIDALCDMIVFSVNAIALLMPNYIIDEKRERNSISFDNPVFCCSLLCTQISDISYRVYMGENNSENIEYEIAFRYEVLLRYCHNMIIKFGYDYDKAMTETLKEINSRVGAFDQAKGKWVKNETKYKANYELARADK